MLSRSTTRIAPNAACSVSARAAADDRRSGKRECRGLLDNLGRAAPDHPKGDKGDDPEPDPGNPEMAVEEPRDPSRGDAHQCDREKKPERHHPEVIRRHPR